MAQVKVVTLLAKTVGSRALLRALLLLLLTSLLYIGVPSRSIGGEAKLARPGEVEIEELEELEEPEKVEASREPKLEDVQKLFAAGKYGECEEMASKGILEGLADESWYLLKIRCQLTTGKYADALKTLEAALKEYPYSVRLRWSGRPAYLFNNKIEEAEKALQEIGSLVSQAAWRYRDPESQVVIGRFLLHQGADARQVLEQIYDRIKKELPDFVDARIAAGDLALEKQDHAVAAQEFEGALKLSPGDPDILHRLSLALAESDPDQAGKHLEAALKKNPNHIDSLLYLIDGAIDREEYDTASGLIDGLLAIHPEHPRALAYRAVLAHLAGDYKGEKAARVGALRNWPSNPAVDCLIGRKLSQKYRFAEGAAYQRRALQLDENHLPSKIQLCQDLLRLGKEEEGWKLAGEVYDEDGYNVVAHNLNTLHDHLAKFRSLKGEGLILRMDAREAAIYGGQALDLLGRAREKLCARYGVQLQNPVVVEIFPEQKDFAIRTFGLPGGAGFLGVCFGSVITANSPASQGKAPSNWHAVLWHEFCHVVTLHKTRNKMPRWLSEGISVYEEKLANPSWGQSMTPQYLKIIEEGGFIPVSKLSGAFLRPPSPLHLQFAYYESSLVVEFLVQKYGFDRLKQILSDLAEGKSINEVLESRTGSLEKLDEEFGKFAGARAAELASRADWESPDFLEELEPEILAAWVEKNPRNFWGLQRQAIYLLSKEQWEEAKKPLEKLLKLCPGYTGPNNAYELLAAIHRKLSERDAEIKLLKKLSELDASAVAANLRLLELCTEERDWKELGLAAERLLAIQPLLKAPHRSLIEAMEKLGTSARGMQAYRALLVMDPIDPADLHFRLARLLRGQGKLKEARRNLLQALEEAPRFRDAHRELLALVRQMEQTEKGEGQTGKEPAGKKGEKGP